MDQDQLKLQMIFGQLRKGLAECLEAKTKCAANLYKVALAIFDLSEQRLQDTAAIQRRQQGILDALLQIARGGLANEAGRAEVEGMIQREMDFIATSEEKRRHLLRSVRAFHFNGEEMPDHQDASIHLTDLFREACLMLPEGDEGDEQSGQRSGSDMEVDSGQDIVLAIKKEAAINMGEEVGELGTPDMVGSNRAELAQSGQAPILIDDDVEPPPAPNPEAAEVRAEATMTTDINHPGGGSDALIPVLVSTPFVNPLPAAPPPLTEVPVVNVISATPQTSQEQPPPPVTSLVVPTWPSRSRSHSPSPRPSSNIMTRSRSRSNTSSIVGPPVALSAPTNQPSGSSSPSWASSTGSGTSGPKKRKLPEVNQAGPARDSDSEEEPRSKKLKE